MWKHCPIDYYIVHCSHFDSLLMVFPSLEKFWGRNASIQVPCILYQKYRLVVFFGTRQAASDNKPEKGRKDRAESKQRRKIEIRLVSLLLLGLTAWHLDKIIICLALHMIFSQA